MPDFWQFPTVSMGLGPLMAIYQARFLKYLHARGIANTETARSGPSWATARWTSLNRSAPSASRRARGLDNLVFVINCNLQRLDGPVRGNGKIIQELEGEFRGSGWNVIKLIWGKGWDELLARDKSGKLKQLMMETVDGDYQAMKANDGALHPQELLRPSRDRQAGRARATTRSSNCAVAATSPRRSTPPSTPPTTTRRASRPCCWIKTVRAMAWARPVKARTPSTRPRSCRTTTSATSATASASRSPTASCPRSRSTSRPTTRRRCATCTSAARPWRLPPHRAA